ncbi:Crp/Fnr family transcriptional regulator [Hyphococcus sp.]|uniref:Crp/Fnr family transcriptional regulator n=1 Tax=Hyphococcus sp. TaxID=2038636 RepID=UPI003CCBB184
MSEDFTLATNAKNALLSPRVMTRLTKAAVRVAYADGAVIHSRGDSKRGLSIIHEGGVRFTNPGLDGSLVSTGVMRPGHFFGEATLFVDLPRTQDAIAIGQTLIDQISKKRFDRIFDEEPELARMMMKVTTERLYLTLEFLDDMRRLPLKARAAKLIVTRASIAEDATVVNANQSEIAFTLGVSRVSIGKALSALQTEGLISLGYGKIQIPDLSGLKSWIAENTPLSPLTYGHSF